MSAVCSSRHTSRLFALDTHTQSLPCPAMPENLGPLTTCGACTVGHKQLKFQPSAPGCGQSLKQSLGAAGCQEGDVPLHSCCALTLPPVTLVWLAFA